MDLQQFLCVQFERYVPPAPVAVAHSRRDVTLQWGRPGGAFGFLAEGELLYRLQRKERFPPWSTVYSGSKTKKTIDNLAPGQPHVFRLQVQLKPAAVQTLAVRALRHHGTGHHVFAQFGYHHSYINAVDTTDGERGDDVEVIETDLRTNKGSDDKANVAKSDYWNDKVSVDEVKVEQAGSTLEQDRGDGVKVKKSDHGTGEVNEENYYCSKNEGNDHEVKIESTLIEHKEENTVCESSTSFKTEKILTSHESHHKYTQNAATKQRPWLESCWSESAWCSTDPQGTSVICFCMAVRCGHIKQVQKMIDERPELVEIINSINGLTPLVTAVIKGELSMVKVLLQAGADANQPAAAGQRPLQFALLAARLDLAALLLAHGADIAARDRNGLRAEHYAADSGRGGAVAWLLERGGDLEVRDNQGWTPLFRAVSQGASSELIADLVRWGADVTAVDRAGLPLSDAARLLHSCGGGPRVSVVRLVDPSYPHERALDHFTRLTKKIYSVQTIFK